MTDRKLMQQALDVIDSECGFGGSNDYDPKAIAAALRDRLAQPEQEPVAVWELQEDGWDTICDGNWLETLPVGTKLYTTPPQRPWVGLTDDEIKEIIDKYTIDDHGFDIWCDGLGVVKAVDDKLRSKNT